jgi:hypothetical protein
MENVNGHVMATQNVNGHGKAPFQQQTKVFLISVPKSQSRHMPVVDSNTLSGANPLRDAMRQGDRPFGFTILRLIKSIASKIETRLRKMATTKMSASQIGTEKFPVFDHCCELDP